MTACVNKKHTRRVALAISASLVGALSLGAAAPAVAFAEDGISTQATKTEEAAFANAKVNYALDNANMSISDLDNIEFEVDEQGKAHYPVIKWVTPEDADNMVNVANCKQVYSYDADGNGKLDESEVGNVDAALAPGQKLEDLTWTTGTQYWVSVYGPADSQYAKGRLDVPFKIVSKSLKGTELVDWKDHDLTYTKEGQNYAFVLDGADVSSSIRVVYYYKNTGEKVTENGGVPINAGDYTAVIVGNDGTDYAGSRAEVSFSIAKRNLNTAVVSISDLPYDEDGSHIPSSAMVDGVAYNSEGKGGQLSISWVGADKDTDIIHDKTTYTVKVTPSEKGEKNFTGEATVTFSIVGTVIDDIYFTDATGAKADVNTYREGNAVVVLLGDHDTHLEQSDFSTAYPTAKLDITVYDAEGNEVEFERLNDTVGTYTVAVRADAKLNEYNFGSDTHTMTVKTRKGTVETEADVVFKYKGDVVDHIIAPKYDGTDVMEDIQEIVRYDGEVLAEGTDYDVVVKDSDGNVVDSIVDAGTYYVSVVSDVYDLSGVAVLEVRVTPIVLKDIKLGSDDIKDFGKDASGNPQVFIPYDGSEHSYYFYYLDGDGNEVRIPDGVVELDHFEYTDLDGELDYVDAIVGKGEYIAFFHPADGVVNYSVEDSESDNGVWVSEGNVFADVPSTHWGAQGIYDAYKLGYMSGYDGTTLFGPADNLTRAQAAIVLYNMGTGKEVDENSTLWNQWTTHATDFSDVKANAWYAPEVGWAATVGVVEGYPTGEYGPDDLVTREQFAIMLRNYAEKLGKDVTVDDVDAALEGVKDADTISDWAREAVAWAVENGVMGAEGYVYADQSIERAQAALMVTRFQPEKLSKDELLISVARPQV